MRSVCLDSGVWCADGKCWWTWRNSSTCSASWWADSSAGTFWSGLYHWSVAVSSAQNRVQWHGFHLQVQSTEDPAYSHGDTGNCRHYCGPRTLFWNPSVSAIPDCCINCQHVHRCVRDMYVSQAAITTFCRLHTANNFNIILPTMKASLKSLFFHIPSLHSRNPVVCHSSLI
jgi:hypothetical protein